ncbi:MAG: hypothetical protein HFH49_10220 [Lachnospiraceae bacterium]|nr:hypothetical protein [Lachnospiraceae bacterium]
MGSKLKIRQALKECLRKFILPGVYRLCCVRYPKTDPRLAVFADAHHREFPEDMRLLKEEMQRRGYRIEELVHDFSEISFGKSVKAMCSFLKYYAQAGLVVLCDYYLPVISVKKRKETKVIQLWHACGAYKKFGYDARDDLLSAKDQNMFCNFDLVSVSSEHCRKIYADAFHLPADKVQALGVSRTDRYFSERFMEDCRSRFFREYPEAAGKKIILWAPTFRNNAAEGTLFGAEAIDRLSEKLSGEWYVVRKVHPHLANKYALAGSCQIPTEQLYGAADLLITDYSSVIFDFALTRKPILIYAPDRILYEQKRGFYLRLEELPAKVVTEEEELLAVLEHGEYHTAPEKYERFIEEQLQMCDGHATGRIADYIADMQKK